MTTIPEDHQPDPAASDLARPDPDPSDPTPPAAGAVPPPSARRSMLAMLLGLTVVAATVAVFWSTGGFRLAGGDGASDPELHVASTPQGPVFRGARLLTERPAPDFTLTSHTGAPFRLQDSRGKATLLFFGFTACPDVCPTTLGKIAGALGALGPDADRVQAILVSVDPERDTPEVMARYLGSFDPRIVGVTGDLKALEAVAGSYGVRFFKEYPSGVASTNADPPASTDYTMAHSSQMFLIDPYGQMRTSFIEPYTPDDIAHDIRVLLDEAGS